MRQEIITSRLRQAQRDSEAKAIAFGDPVFRKAIRDTHRPQPADAERGAPRGMPFAISGPPGRAVARRAGIALVPAVGGQRKDVAAHVVEPERVGFERADRRGFGIMIGALDQAATAIFGLVGRVGEVLIAARLLDVVSPIEGRRGAAARGIFPFGLRGQPVFLSRGSAQPGSCHVACSCGSQAPWPAVMQPRRGRKFVACANAANSARVIANLPSAKGLAKVTWCCGSSRPDSVVGTSYRWFSPGAAPI